MPRFNMPLELGIFLGAKRFGDEDPRHKRCLVLDVERFRYQKFISDLAGVDIHGHAADPRRVVEVIRNWLTNVSRRKLPAAALLSKLHTAFLADKDKIANELGFAPTEIPYVDFERIVTEWLLKAPPA